METEEKTKIIECIENIPYGIDIFEKLNVHVPYNEYVHTITGDFLYFKPAKIVYSDNVAIFNFQWGVCYAEYSLFVKNDSDLHILPERISKLNDLIKKGYNILIYYQIHIVKNENFNKNINLVSSWIRKLLRKIKIPVQFLCTFAEKQTFKNAIEIYKEITNKKDCNIIYCTYKFEKSTIPPNIKFVDVEEFFKKKINMNIFMRDKLVIFLFGMPGCTFKKIIDILTPSFIFTETLTELSGSKIITMLPKTRYERDRLYYNLNNFGYRYKILYLIQNGKANDKINKIERDSKEYENFFNDIIIPETHKETCEVIRINYF